MLSGPRLVPPGEQDEENFADDVGIGNIEVMFQCRHRNVSVDILVKIILPGLHSVLTNLESHLSGRIVDETTKVLRESIAPHVSLSRR